ncbi:MAG: hypothetical protein K0R68_941 [Mycobacterium sp.]|nr:hypothetical protein [Mycobacterium sp.]
MTELPCCLLVVAKAPVPGLAKTRLAASIGDIAAADIAAAALLDTLDAVAASPVAARVVALTGDLDAAARAGEIRARLASFTVIDQRGEGFAQRLAHAHLDSAAAFPGLPVLQIGMDTPQVTAELLTAGARQLLAGDAVLGLAGDGGWWALGVSAPQTAACLSVVPMSRSDTGALTLAAVRATGAQVTLLPELDDVDTIDDIEGVRAVCTPTGRFAEITATVGV